MSTIKQKTDEVALAQVKKCQTEPGIHLDDPLTQLSALWIWNVHHVLSHQCYWNDRFVVAVMCDMPKETQRGAAWAVLKNGLCGYWEWNTHYGLDMLVALRQLGIEPCEAPQRDPSMGIYSRGPLDVLRRLVEQFCLPFRFDGQDLTAKQRDDKQFLNMHFPSSR